MAVIMFECFIPGSDPATAAVHGIVEMGMAGFAVAAGAIFLARALLTYRRDRQSWTLIELRSMPSTEDEPER